MPLVDLANPLNSGGLRQLAGPFGDVFGPGDQFPNSYEFGKRFVSTASSVSGGGNGVTSLDDPTYLGFQIRFDGMSPLFNGAEIGSTEPPVNQVPSIADLAAQELGFINGNPDDTTNANSGNHPSVNSAVGYLEKVGEANRANYLRSFVQGIRHIERTRPYYFQTIEGLSEAWNKTVNMIDPYGGAAEGEGITIGLLEAIDLKMSALFSLYKLACYDTRYKRTVLPINLMYFNVDVDVFEIRKFKTVRNWLAALNLSDTSPDTINFVNENTSKITFRFEECTWDPTQTGVIFGNVTNAGGNAMAVSSMKWDYGRVLMDSQFSGYNSALKDAAQQKPESPTLKNAVKNFAKDQLANAAKGAVNNLQRGLSSKFQSFALGNVFGLRNQIFSAIQNPQAVLSAAQGALVQTDQIGGELASINRLGDNPLGEGVQPPNSLPTDNINAGQIPSDPSPLNSNNIFGRGPSGPAPLESNNVFE